MKRYLLDTNAAADFIFRRKGVDVRAKLEAKNGAKIGVALPVAAELFAGAEFSLTREKNLDVINRNLRILRIWPFTMDAARTYGRLFAEMRKVGRTTHAMDLMIASIALSLGNCIVISRDSDMFFVPGLCVESWTT